MKRIISIVSLLLLLSAMAMPMSAQVVSNDNEDEVYKVDKRMTEHDYVAGQVLVKFKDQNRVNIRHAKGKFLSADHSAVNEVLQKYGTVEMEQLLPREKAGRTLRKAKAFNGTIIAEKDLSQLYCVKMSEEHSMEVKQLVDELNVLDEVEFAEPNYRLYTLDDVICNGYAGNPLVTNQWYLSAYGVNQLWTKPIVNSVRPVIAILDTGVDITHPDLADNIWTNESESNGEEGYDNDNNGFKNDVHGWDFINNSPEMRDNNMHGTHVAGIAAASNNGLGIIGANPLAYIMPITVLQSDATGDVATIIRGIDYAIANGATVLNFSLGTYANSSALRQTLERAYQSAVIVAAAGNDGRCVYSSHKHSIIPAPMFPAAYSFVLGVQAITQIGSLAGFSNYDDNGPNFSSESTFSDPDGFNYELKAPGVNMLSTVPGGNYKVLNGTSMASPLVAGAISALKMVKEYDSQEILWGDLLHSDNIAQAYNMSQRPAELDLMRVMYRERKELSEETEEDYSGDGRIDAGETVSLYPVIRTTFGEASNIRMHLEMGDEYEDPNTVEILTGEVDFGMHLDAYGKGVSMNPLQLKVADNVANGRHIKMKVVVTCDESNVTYEGLFTMVVDNMIKISGLISENCTLTADHIYLINDDIGIMEGTTLTIEPGTRLEFMGGKGITSFGRLIARGTPENPIIFANHNDSKGGWIRTHESKGIQRSESGVMYTNEDSTIFTALPTEVTPNKININRDFFFRFCYTYKENPAMTSRTQSFSISEYLENFSYDMSTQMDKLSDPNYWTPAIYQTMNDIEAYCDSFPTVASGDYTLPTTTIIGIPSWCYYDTPRDTLEYCRLHFFDDTNSSTIIRPYLRDCIIDCSSHTHQWMFQGMQGIRNVIHNIKGGRQSGISSDLCFSNIVNNVSTGGYYGSWYFQLNYINYFNNTFMGWNWLDAYSDTPGISHSDTPSYLGTSREDIVRPHVREMGNGGGFNVLDLSNMPARPYAEAHGIVWKVVVNGYDAQDEFEQLPPLGVGRHKFEVYFNRPMNVAVAPNISFGVRDPYTQHAVSEDGEWSADSTIYTAYYTITGKTKSDGLNRIYVYGAEDDEYFEIPYEKSRFNINIQAAGSMATGFAAEAGLGRVSLTWNNENNNFEDAMGFNIYRYTTSPNPSQEGEPVNDTIRINQNIVDIEATSYVDYDVVPGETYYYFYKVLSTDLQEYDVSNVVAVTPLTGELGDANGSGEVDVADVITTVNYAAGQQPKPFIFEAADMNADLSIDILDVIGIIKKIMSPNAEVKPSIFATATYTIEDGILYVESPVALAGVQVQLSLSEELRMKNEELRVAEDLNGFEHTSAWLSDNDFLFLAYNMSGKTLGAGKHALLHIGDAKIADIRLSDANGHNVKAEGIETDKVNRIIESMSMKGVYDLQGRKLYGTPDNVKLPKGVYIINGKKVVR